MELVRRTNSTYNQINRNVRILKSEKIVIVKTFGRLKIIQLNRENDKTRALLKALNILNKTVN